MNKTHATLHRLAHLKRLKMELDYQAVRQEMNTLDTEIQRLSEDIENVSAAPRQSAQQLITHQKYIDQTIRKITLLRSHQSDLQPRLYASKEAFKNALHAEDQVRQL